MANLKHKLNLPWREFAMKKNRIFMGVEEESVASAVWDKPIRCHLNRFRVRTPDGRGIAVDFSDRGILVNLSDGTGKRYSELEVEFDLRCGKCRCDMERVLDDTYVCPDCGREEECSFRNLLR